MPMLVLESTRSSYQATLQEFYLNGSPDAEKLQSIDQWCDIQWESMNSAFRVATNMVLPCY